MSKDEYEYYVYIITNHKNGVLYIGVTGNLKQRLYQHKRGNSKSFSSRYKLNKLIYYELYEYPSLAIKREKQIKKWNRSWKINLIKDFNPDWEDLSSRFQ